MTRTSGIRAAFDSLFGFRWTAKKRPAESRRGRMLEKPKRKIGFGIELQGSQDDRIGHDSVISDMAIKSLLSLTHQTNSFCMRCGATDFHSSLAMITEDIDGFSCLEVLCPMCFRAEIEMKQKAQ